jgi:hypothetical protein
VPRTRSANTSRTSARMSRRLMRSSLGLVRVGPSSSSVAMATSCGRPLLHERPTAQVKAGMARSQSSSLILIPAPRTTGCAALSANRRSQIEPQVTVRALRMACLRVCGGAGLAPAAGLIRSLSALGRDSSQSCRCGFPCQAGRRSCRCPRSPTPSDPARTEKQGEATADSRPREVRLPSSDRRPSRRRHNNSDESITVRVDTTT